MWSIPRIQGPVLVVFLATLVFGCGEDCEKPACPDTVPPMAVTGLRAASTTDSSVTLAWTAPGDDGDQGTAAQYDIRYSDIPDTSADWWDSLTIAPQVETLPGPGPAGAGESFTVTGLVAMTTHYFALKTADEVPNWSGLSNVPEARTLVAPPPPPEMVLVPAGSFIMGDGVAYCGEDEREVTLTRDFLIGQHEVTNQEYMENVQWAYDHGYVTATTSEVRDNLDGSTEWLLDLDSEYGEIEFDGADTFYLRQSPSSLAEAAYPLGYDPADHPVKEVTWYGSVRYCDWLGVQTGLPRAYEHSGDWSCNGGDPYGAAGYRLPTDAEWEYAAQFDDERIYPWGDEAPDCSRANFNDYSGSGDYCVGWTSPVGSYPDAPEALGLSDMAGNVWEWCNDACVCDLGTAPVTDPTGPGSGRFRVLRGGGWGSHVFRCASRNFSHPHLSDSPVGFRAARTVAP